MNKSYVISKCLNQTLKNRYNLNLNVQTRNEIDKLEQNFINEFKGYITEQVDFVTLEYNDVKTPVINKIIEENNPIISLDDIYFNINDTPQVCDSLSVTRTVKPDSPFGEASIEGRNGFPLKSVQLEKLANKYCGKNISILDIGIFSGETLVELIEDFKEYNIIVDRVYVSICGKDSLKEINGKNYLNNGYTGEVEIITNSNQEYDFEDWLEFRDILWIDGRNVDSSNIQGYESSKIFVPYRENPSKFMTIDDDNVQDVINLGDKYFEKLNQIIENDGYRFELNKLSEDVLYELKILSS